MIPSENKFEDDFVPDTPFYRACTQPVSIEDLCLGLHVGNAAVLSEFPMKKPSERFTHFQDVTYSFSDIPYLKAMFGIKDAFHGESKNRAVFTRLTSLQEMVLAHKKNMKKWCRRHGKDFEFADALMDVAAYFPFKPGTYEFDLKAFLKEVQRVADERYGGKFT